MNDFLGGADTPQEALSLFHRLREVLQKGGFNLTEWRSSSSAVLQDIPPELQEVSHLTSLQAPTISKARGIQKEMSCHPLSTTYTNTKRGVIRDVART